ncbi:minor capsid protein [Brevibacillus laterosporus]|uniref:minor capsid protein n=1 Tax=Brevibacillus laterosporus TaxID=1465 RepID=UPI0018F8A791|nr:minor capsid protein [Brevibacillus laterosporus]MBG9772411.1 hypothetical protein [Brevibacillus laterosporus]
MGKDYWIQRAEQRAEKVYKRADSLERTLKKNYEQAYRQVMKDLESYAARFGLTYQSLMKKLSALDREGFYQFVKDNTEKLIKGGEVTEEMVERFFPEWDPAKVIRLTSIQAHLSERLSQLALKNNKETKRHLSQTYKEVYKDSATDVAKAIGINTPVYRLDEEKISSILQYKWSGANFSERIWDDTAKLKSVLNEEIVRSAIRGSSVKQVANNISRIMDSSYKNAVRVVRTETNYFDNQAQVDSFSGFGLKQYEYIAAMDRRTSEICRNMDGKIFNIKDAVPGVNQPPLHPHCRSTIVPYFDD